MRNLIIITLFMCFITNFSFAQISTQKNYKNVKIKLTSGKILGSENITITDSELYIIRIINSVPTIYEKYTLSDVEYIKSASIGYLPYGAVIGGVFAVGIVEYIKEYHGRYEILHKYECTYEYPPGGYGSREHCTTLEYKKTWITPSTEEQLIIYALGVTLGASMGYSIKGIFEKIYPTKNKPKISIGFPLRNNPSSVQVLSMQFSF